MRGAARLHDHIRALAECVDEAFELPPREALTIENATGAIRDGHLEHVLRQIDRDGRRIHDCSSWLSR
jgi:hypothetical protein